jgi:hypothetical protein
MPLFAPISDGSGDPHRMVNETDADRIQREKDRRRAEERLRIEREHHRRLHDVEILRRTAPHLGPDGPEKGLAGARAEPPPEPSRPSRPPAPPPEAAPVPEKVTPPVMPDTKPTPGPVSRPIGRPIQSEALRKFLAIDPAEKFDIQVLNQLPIAPLLHEGTDDPKLLALLAERSEALMDRVKREVDDSLAAGAMLREFALAWYRQSPSDPSWSETAPVRWGGIFAESKVSGGKLQPWLNMRLWALHQRSIREGGVGHRFRRGLSRSHVAEESVSRTATQLIQAEVAQALVDDLASAPRKPEAHFPLIHLSELAVRRQVATVNEALAVLFNSSETGPFVVLHPNRYPDCEELQIRPPVGNASGAALAFSLVTPKGPRKSGGRAGGPGRGEGGEGPGGSLTGVGEEEGIDASTIWEAKAATEATWRFVLDEGQREKRRLDPPPKDYRTRQPYASLRELLLRDPEVRKTFLAVKWRGRPSGLPLVIALLQKGTIAPEVATDHEYLEAELGEISQGDPQFVPEGGTWKLPGWTVIREGTHQEGFRYRAIPESAGPPAQS